MESGETVWSQISFLWSLVEDGSFPRSWTTAAMNWASQHEKCELPFKHWETCHGSPSFHKHNAYEPDKQKVPNNSEHFSVGYDTCQINLEVSGGGKWTLFADTWKS